MSNEYIVVDGSNIATEGRSAPSLSQLEEAVAELRREYPEAEVTVIVDATFSHRIDPAELDRFETAALAGEYVHPPAGAIGRGDAFLLRIAEKVDGIALSNDSFQEFHGEHPWLFERGRLLGATPVPGVGWIFTPRTPVRGPKSRQAVRDTDKAKRKVSKAIEAATKEAVTPGKAPASGRGRGRSRPAAADAPAPGAPSRAPRRAAPEAATAPAVNDPLTFVSFIADHPLGTEVEGEVENYTSHGAVVFVNGTQCYVPLANMSVPPPRSAREMLKRGERQTFVVTALDPQRRGVELSLPGVGVVSGTPSEETIAAEVQLAKKGAGGRAGAGPRKRAGAPAQKIAIGTSKKAPEPRPAPARAVKVVSEEPAGDLASATAGEPASATAGEPVRRSGRAPKKAADQAPKRARTSKKAAEPAAKAAHSAKKAVQPGATAAQSAKKAVAALATRAAAPATKGRRTSKNSPEPVKKGSGSGKRVAGPVAEEVPPAPPRGRTAKKVPAPAPTPAAKKAATKASKKASGQVPAARSEHAAKTAPRRSGRAGSATKVSTAAPAIQPTSQLDPVPSSQGRKSPATARRAARRTS